MTEDSWQGPGATPLAKKLAARIVSGGPISLHDYMEACLYDAEHGYYRAKAGIGQTGDFITAPEISQIFGELIGLWAAEVWQRMGKPAPVRLIELGPGRGVLMVDALRALRTAPDFLAAATVHLVESSQALREAQRTALLRAPVRVFWHDGVEDAPSGAAIVIANEFFDCLPVRQFVFDGSARQWRERMAGWRGGVFHMEEGAFAGLLAETFPIEAGDGAIFEHRPAVQTVIDSFAARSPLAALIVDYGPCRPCFGDTVQAVKNHRFAGLFDAPGESDITAHVDFFSLKQAADKAKLGQFGPMPMGEWLLRLGLERRVQQLLARASVEEADEIRSGVARLVDPAQMGALFKALALTHGFLAPPPPF